MGVLCRTVKGSTHFQIFIFSPRHKWRLIHYLHKATKKKKPSIFRLRLLAPTKTPCARGHKQGGYGVVSEGGLRGCCGKWHHLTFFIYSAINSDYYFESK